MLNSFTRTSAYQIKLDVKLVAACSINCNFRTQLTQRHVQRQHQTTTHNIYHSSSPCIDYLAFSVTLLWKN